jgi:hypothetical protein
MALATWWRSDPLPSLPVVPGFHAVMSDDDVMLARLNRIPLAEVRARRHDGHRPYIGRLHDMPVAYGWVATRSASIGELNLTITLSQRDRYLWDFATLPAAAPAPVGVVWCFSWFQILCSLVPRCFRGAWLCLLRIASSAR